jgi:hypothetical protein
MTTKLEKYHVKQVIEEIGIFGMVMCLTEYCQDKENEANKKDNWVDLHKYCNVHESLIHCQQILWKHGFR